MEDDQTKAGLGERRTADREPMQGAVTVAFGEQSIVGPGQNVSEEGVFFIVEGALRVRVRTSDGAEWRDGEVIRVQTMGEGKLGMAVRFC